MSALNLDLVVEQSGLEPAIPLGIITGEEIKTYHATDAVSHSKLETFRDPDRGHARYHGQYIAGTIPRFAGSAATEIGSAVDALVLEKRRIFDALPETYLSEKGETKPFTMAANACKAMRAAIEAQGLIPIKSADAELVTRMRDAVFVNHTAASLLTVGSPQVTMRAQLGAFAVQARPDWWCHADARGKSYIVDLKTAEDMDQFLANRRAFGYSRQAALYREVARLTLASQAGCSVEEIEAPAFYFIVVFKTPPIQAVVFRESDEEIALATEEVTDDLRRLKRCYETNTWPGVPEGINELPKIWRKAA